jgi:hypothetical protein
MNAELRQLILRRGPVGRWRTAEGSAGMLVGERYEFSPDGVGRIHTHSSVFGDETLGFVWHMAAPSVLRVRRVDPDDEEVDPWTTVEMEFRTYESDTGKQEVLAEKGHEGFWLAFAPLTWDGP